MLSPAPRTAVSGHRVRETLEERTRKQNPTDGLAEYRKKRDFGATSEPVGVEEGEAGGRFVVQEHSATRLHWDLRLERDGVAVSWAVPNGIPEVPGELRKAVHTEDHPLEYLTWEGEIPKGQYGAGTMKVWDHGTYECHEWTDRKATVTFHGERVRGRYHLFQTGADAKDWMIRRYDPPSDPDREPMPQHVAPVCAVSGSLPRDDSGSVFEIEWNGARAFAFYEPGRLRVEDVTGADITDKHPELRRLTRQLGSHSAVLDGELVKAGTNRFYEIYDVVYLDGHSLAALPWRERRARLVELELEGPAWRTSRVHEGDGAALLAAAREQGLAGIVAKPLDSPYAPGAGWIAIAADDEARVEPTHPERVLYQEAGFTKADMAAYYRAVASVILPHLSGRPLMECPPQAPDWLTRVAVPSERRAGRSTIA